MDSNHPDSSQDVSKHKRKRRVMTIGEKAKVLEMIEEGKTVVEIGRYFGVNNSTIRTIKKAENRIRKTADITFNMSAKWIISSHHKPLILMEAALVTCFKWHPSSCLIRQRWSASSLRSAPALLLHDLIVVSDLRSLQTNSSQYRKDNSYIECQQPLCESSVMT